MIMLRILRLSLLLAFALSMNESAFASPRVNNGGGAWACPVGPQANDEYTFIRSADLFEAELAGLRIITPVCDAECILTDRLNRIHHHVPDLSALIEKHRFELNKKIRFIDELLSETQDKGLFKVPTHLCESQPRYIQIADFRHEETLLISKPAWNHASLQEQDKAAILLHELIYFALRKSYGDETSRRARRLVGILFSSLPDTELNSRISRILRSRAGSRGGEIRELGEAFFACEITVRENPSGNYLSREWWTSPGANSARYFKSHGYSFEIVSSATTTLPAYINIDEISGDRNLTLSEAEITSELQRSGAIDLQLKNSRVDATVHCWAELE